MILSNTQSYLNLFILSFSLNSPKSDCFSKLSSEYVQCSQSTACGATEFCSKEEKKPSILWNIRIIVSLDKLPFISKIRIYWNNIWMVLFINIVFSVVVIVVFHLYIPIIGNFFYLCCYGGKLITVHCYNSSNRYFRP